MQVNSLLNTGLKGFQDANLRANQAASEIASHTVSDASEQSIDQNDLTTSLIDLKTAEIDAKANIKVVETAANLIGTLLDIKA